MSNAYLLMLEEARQNFFQFENWLPTLDTKSSILIAIDAIILSSLTLIPRFNEQNLFVRIFIISLPVLSIAFSVACLYPRKWDRPDCEKIVSKYMERELDLTIVELAKTYARWETDLFNRIYHPSQTKVSQLSPFSPSWLSSVFNSSGLILPIFTQ